MKLQPEEGFILKVVQLQELFEVRHSVFIIGNAGTGKSQIWKTLIRTIPILVKLILNFSYIKSNAVQ